MSPRVCYVPKEFRFGTLQMIDAANAIIEEYTAEDFTLTLRQLYYQFVARGWLANRQQEYKRLGSVLNDARLAGLVDWTTIEDRTRDLRGRSHWSGPDELVQSAAQDFGLDRWEGQPQRVEVWIEKDALIGVIERACIDLDVPYLSCRGYTSQSEMWSAGMRLVRWARRGYDNIVLHLGDHDPSGIDMTRDITDRLELFCRHHGASPPQVIRIALTREQIEEYEPPPNPAKVTDSRWASYVAEHGYDSWELDALDPRMLDGLIREHVGAHLDDGLYEEREDEETEGRRLLQLVADDWPAVAERYGNDGRNESDV